MISRLIVILMVVGLSACGDDAGSGSEAPEPQSQNNETNTNNDSVSQGSTNTGLSNNATNSDDTNNTNAGVTNNTTVKTSTNNETTNPEPAGTLSCMDVLGCLLSCHADDEACEQDCRELGDDDARAQIDDYLTCVDTLCAEAMTVTALTECTLDKCSEEQDTCLNPEGE